MARVLLAPDKFKGSLTAAEVSAHLAAGIRARRSDVEVVTAAVSDGGDGLLDACVSAGYELVPVAAVDALDRPVQAAYARRGARAVVELAAVCGLAQLGPALAPLTATSRGVGLVLAAALDAGCTQLVLGIGGSASTDGGAGMLQALGARAVDAQGRDLGPGGAALAHLAALDLDRLHPGLRTARLDVAADVANPLTGPRGAAAVYGPQKGAGADEVRELDAALGHWADVVAAATGVDRRNTPGAGAAGGVGFAALAVLGAQLRPGVELVLELTGFPALLAGADLVITGEGSLDEQSLNGKAPVGVAAAARAAGVPVVAVAGRCLLDDVQLKEAGFEACHSLTTEAGSEQAALREPAALLRGIGARIAERL